MASRTELAIAQSRQKEHDEQTLVLRGDFGKVIHQAGHRRWMLTRVRARQPLIVLDDVNTHLNTFITDEHEWASDQLANRLVWLRAKAAAQVVRHRFAFRDLATRSARDARRPGNRDRIQCGCESC